jgi:hypothetical protein
VHADIRPLRYGRGIATEFYSGLSRCSGDMFHGCHAKDTQDILLNFWLNSELAVEVATTLSMIHIIMPQNGRLIRRDSCVQVAETDDGLNSGFLCIISSILNRDGFGMHVDVVRKAQRFTSSRIGIVIIVHVIILGEIIRPYHDIDGHNGICSHSSLFDQFPILSPSIRKTLKTITVFSPRPNPTKENAFYPLS